MLRIRPVANAGAVDAWTPVHVISGAIAGRLGMSFPLYLGLAVAYEAVEYAHEYPRGSRIFGSKRPESKTNIVVDLIAGIGGYLLFRR